jgi:hypothetical protein
MVSVSAATSASVCCDLITSGTYSEQLTLTPIQAIPGAIELRVSSQLTSARDPNQAHIRYRTMLDTDALLRLRQAIDDVLAVHCKNL